MKPEFILLTIVGGFLCALIVFLVIFYKPTATKIFVPTTIDKQEKAAATDSDQINSLKSQIKSIEERLNAATPAAQTESLPTYKSILATASVQGPVATTSSAEYTPIGLFINISCPKNCLLWIDFYSSSKNLGPIGSEQGNLHTYSLFLDGADKSIYTQGSLTVANSSTPISLNTLLSVAAGTHTVEVKAKTTGGTLQSNSSFLQIIAIEK